MKKFLTWRFIGIPLGLLSFLLFLILKQFPSQTEIFYNSFYSIYQKIRSILLFLPGDFLYFLPGALVLVLIVITIIQYAQKKLKFVQLISTFLSLIGFAVFFFYVFWGYNYARPSLESRLAVEVTTPTYGEIFDNLDFAIHELNQYRSNIELKDTIAWYDDSFTVEMQEVITSQVTGFLSDYGYNTEFKTVVNELRPKGILRRFGSSGMFLPWSGEAYYDSGVPNISRPNTFAHELAHVCGITNEGESNFVAYQAGLQTKIPLVQYSAAHAYYRYAARVAYQTDSLKYKEAILNLDSLVLEDILSKRKSGLLYPDFFPKTRDKVYNQYLKTQGVKTGIADYSKMYVLANAWRKQN